MRLKRLTLSDKEFIQKHKDKLSLEELSFLTGIEQAVIQQYINKITPPPPAPEKVIIRLKQEEEKAFVRPPAVYSNTNWNEYEP